MIKKAKKKIILK